MPLTLLTPRSALQYRVMIVSLVHIQFGAALKFNVALKAVKRNAQSLLVRLHVLSHICLRFVLIWTTVELAREWTLVRMVSDMVREVEKF